jgi:hypothetical protein
MTAIEWGVSDHAAATSTGRMLEVLLEHPRLVQQVRALTPAQASELVRRVGLEDAGELLALLAPEQLAGLLDDVLWGAEAPGADEEFDPGRFAIWLEVMLEAGEQFAADQLVELSEDLVALAVSRAALVLDLGEVVAEANDEAGELFEKTLDGCLHEEIGEHLLVARRHDGWDALVSVLLALDTRHSGFLERVLHRCWLAAHESLDDHGGLRELITAEELLEIDAAAEREDRRAGRGYVSPASARAFLVLAARDDELVPGEDDAISRAYFRELDRAHDLGPHARVLEQLAFLTNVLVAAGPHHWRPAAAAEQALATCEAGLERLAAPNQSRDATLAQWGMIAAFRAGWGRRAAATRDQRVSNAPKSQTLPSRGSPR